MTQNNPLAVSISGIQLKNPVLGASGTVDFGKPLAKHFDLSLLGGFCGKSLTLEPRAGNQGVIYHTTPSGLMNSVGLKNPGVKHFVEGIYPYLKDLDTQVIGSVAGSSIDEYLAVIDQLNATDLDILELNISCPNVSEGGMAFGAKCETASEVVAAARQATDKVLMVKLSPSAENIQAMAQTCVAAGADALSLINTIPALAIDVKGKKAVFDRITAGLSGPAIRPVALRMVWEVAQVVEVPIVGIGGIETYEDVLAFIMAGATAVQVGTINYEQPWTMAKIIQDLKAYAQAEGLTSLNEIRGII